MGISAHAEHRPRPLATPGAASPGARRARRIRQPSAALHPDRPAADRGAPGPREPAGLENGGLFHRFGAIALQAAAHPIIQPKLRVSAPGDAYEREADRVARAVTAGGGARATAPSLRVQPKLLRAVLRPEDMVDSMPPPDGSSAQPVQASPYEELQREATADPAGVTPHFEQALHGAVRGSAEPLPPATRSFMEERIGHDLSSVRVHTDAKADTLARGINARAFTLGNDVFFASSQFRPETSRGRFLLAHELTHVIQQSQGRVARQVQRKTRCGSYPGYDTSVDLKKYNCAGLALRTYKYTAPASAVLNEIGSNFVAPETPLGSCSPGAVKFWLWEYDLHFEDDRGTVLRAASPDFHIVAGITDANGSDPTDVYSKNGRRPVYGPNTGPHFKPAARERSTSNDPSETPATTPQGRPVMKVRSNMTEAITCAECHP